MKPSKINSDFFFGKILSHCLDRYIYPGRRVTGDDYIAT